MTPSLLTTAASGSWATDASTRAFESLVDTGLIVLIALTVIWALTTWVIIARDQWQERKRSGYSRPEGASPSKKIREGTRA